MKLFGMPILFREPGWWELEHALCKVETILSSDTSCHDVYVVVSKYCNNHHEFFILNETKKKKGR